MRSPWACLSFLALCVARRAGAEGDWPSTTTHEPATFVVITTALHPPSTTTPEPTTFILATTAADVASTLPPTVAASTTTSVPSTTSVTSTNALNAVAEDIAGNGNGVAATAAQINLIAGVSGAVEGTDYSAGLMQGTFADRSSPTAAEVQVVVDSVNGQVAETTTTHTTTITTTITPTPTTTVTTTTTATTTTTTPTTQTTTTTTFTSTMPATTATTTTMSVATVGATKDVPQSTTTTFNLVPTTEEPTTTEATTFIVPTTTTATTTTTTATATTITATTTATAETAAPATTTVATTSEEPRTSADDTTTAEPDAVAAPTTSTAAPATTTDAPTTTDAKSQTGLPPAAVTTDVPVSVAEIGNTGEPTTTYTTATPDISLATTREEPTAFVLLGTATELPTQPAESGTSEGTMTMILTSLDHTLMTASEADSLRAQIILTVVASSDGALQQSDVVDVLLAAQQARSSRRHSREAVAATVATVVFRDSMSAVEVEAVADTLNVAIDAGQMSMWVTVQGQPSLIVVAHSARAGGAAQAAAATSTLATTGAALGAARGAAAGKGTVLEKAAGLDNNNQNTADHNSTPTAVIAAVLVLLSVAVLVVGVVMYHKQRQQRAGKVEEASSGPGWDCDLEGSAAGPAWGRGDGGGDADPASIGQDEPAFTFATAVSAPRAYRKDNRMTWLGGVTTDSTVEDFDYAELMDALPARRRSGDADADSCLHALAAASALGNGCQASSTTDDDVISGAGGEYGLVGQSVYPAYRDPQAEEEYDNIAGLVAARGAGPSTRSGSTRSGSSAGSFEENNYRLSVHMGGLLRVNSVKRANPLYTVGEEIGDTPAAGVVDAMTSTL